MRRIEIVEEAIDGTVSRIDKFMSQNHDDLSKIEKIEKALQDQLELVQHLNVQVSSNQLSVQNMEDTIDRALQTLKAEVQGEIDGGTDGLKKSLNILETEMELVRKS